MLLRLPGYIFPELRLHSTFVGGYYAKVVEGWFGSGFWTMEIFIILLLVFQAFLINIMVQEHRISREVTLFPGLFYLLIVNSVPAFFQATGPLIANTFIIYALWQMMAIYRKPSCAGSIFNIGLAIGIGTFFYFSMFSLAVWGLLGLNTLRAFRFKEFLIFLSGMITPYLLVFTWFFWTDAFGMFIQKHFVHHFGFNGVPYLDSLMDYWVNGLVAILVLTVLFSGRIYTLKQNIPTQKKISIIQWSLFFLILSLFIQLNFEWEHWIIAGVPLGIFISMNFYHMKKGVAESFHMIWFVAVLFLQFFPLLQ